MSVAIWARVHLAKLLYLLDPASPFITMPGKTDGAAQLPGLAGPAALGPATRDADNGEKAARGNKCVSFLSEFCSTDPYRQGIAASRAAESMLSFGDVIQEPLSVRHGGNLTSL